MAAGQVPRGEIFLDSPLAIEASEVFLQRGWNRATGGNPFQGAACGRAPEVSESDRFRSFLGSSSTP